MGSAVSNRGTGAAVEGQDPVFRVPSIHSSGVIGDFVAVNGDGEGIIDVGDVLQIKGTWSNTRGGL